MRLVVPVRPGPLGGVGGGLRGCTGLGSSIGGGDGDTLDGVGAVDQGHGAEVGRDVGVFGDEADAQVASDVSVAHLGAVGGHEEGVVMGLDFAARSSNAVDPSPVGEPGGIELRTRKELSTD
jgi:hypothetical protein